jgi:hypothetical protein
MNGMMRPLAEVHVSRHILCLARVPNDDRSTIRNYTDNAIHLYRSRVFPRGGGECFFNSRSQFFLQITREATQPLSTSPPR